MGLEEVVSEIINNARKEAEEIKREGRKEAQNIINNARKEAEEMEKKWRAETNLMIESLKKRELASARLEGYKKIMHAKKEKIEDFMNHVLKELNNLPKPKKEKLLKNLAETVKKEMEVHTIYCNAEDEKILRQYFKNVKFERDSIESGFIAENKDGSVRVDMSFSSLIEKEKKYIAQILTSRLF